jgi:hypothetical protein
MVRKILGIQKFRVRIIMEPHDVDVLASGKKRSEVEGKIKIRAYRFVQL